MFGGVACRWRNMSTDDPLRRLLREHFGYDNFRGDQAEIIRHLTANRDEGGAAHSLVLMPTGGGKSLCYQLPALYFAAAGRGGTLVISPLIALMQDQVQALKAKGIAADFVNSTISAAERDRRIADYVAGKIHILYVTPERFRKRSFIESLRRSRTALFAVDEAHCISQWGGDFRPDYARLGEFREHAGRPLTVALTATATPDVQEDIIEKLGLTRSEVSIFHQGIRRPNLRLGIRECFGEEEKIEALLEVARGRSGAGIVYFALIKSLERFSERLEREGVEHRVYHGKLGTKERKRTLNAFLRNEPGARLMLATNAFGLGVDKPDIRFVLHAEVPGSLEAYYQEIGRAGRDGADALCLLLYDQEDLAIQLEFLKWSNPEPRFVERLFELLVRDPEKVRGLGLEFLREQLLYKHRGDFRLETALRLFDRYGVFDEDRPPDDPFRLAEGVTEPPPELTDEDDFSAKLEYSQRQLAELVKYVRSDECLRVTIARYFGFDDEPRCGNCDVCDRN